MSAATIAVARRWVSPGEAAMRLKRSREWVVRNVQFGLLVGRLVNGRYQVLEASVEQLLNTPEVSK